MKASEVIENLDVGRYIHYGGVMNLPNPLPFPPYTDEAD